MERLERLIELLASAQGLGVRALDELGLTDGTPWIVATAAILTAVVVHARTEAAR